MTLYTSKIISNIVRMEQGTKHITSGEVLSAPNLDKSIAKDYSSSSLRYQCSEDTGGRKLITKAFRLLHSPESIENLLAHHGLFEEAAEAVVQNIQTSDISQDQPTIFLGSSLATSEPQLFESITGVDINSAGDDSNHSVISASSSVRALQSENSIRYEEHLQLESSIFTPVLYSSDYSLQASSSKNSVQDNESELTTGASKKSKLKPLRLLYSAKSIQQMGLIDFVDSLETGVRCTLDPPKLNITKTPPVKGKLRFTAVSKMVQNANLIIKRKARSELVEISSFLSVTERLKLIDAEAVEVPVIEKVISRSNASEETQFIQLDLSQITETSGVRVIDLVRGNDKTWDDLYSSHYRDSISTVYILPEIERIASKKDEYISLKPGVRVDKLLSSIYSSPEYIEMIKKKPLWINAQNSELSFTASEESGENIGFTQLETINLLMDPSYRQKLRKKHQRCITSDGLGALQFKALNNALIDHNLHQKSRSSNYFPSSLKNHRRNNWGGSIFSAIFGSNEPYQKISTNIHLDFTGPVAISDFENLGDLLVEAMNE